MSSPLLDRRAERVELGQAGAVRVRNEEADELEPLGKALGDPRAKLVEPFPVERRDLERVGIAVVEAASARLVDGVDLVQHELAQQLVGPDLVQDGVDRRDLLDEPFLGCGRVDNVEHEVRDECLLERRGETLDELRRQAADEPDCVGDEVAAAGLLEAARRRIERLEEAVADGDARIGERVEKRRLAGVGVSRERDGRRLAAAPFLPADVTLAAETLPGAPSGA